MGKLRFNFEHLDAAENAFFLREFEFISKRMFEVQYVQGMTRQLLPVNNEVPPEDESYTYTMWDYVAKAKAISTSAEDLPEVGVFGTQTTQALVSYGLSFSYSKDEIAKGQKLGRPLDVMRADAVRKGLEKQLDDIAADGDASTGLTGFLGLSNTESFTPGTKGAGGTAWIDANGALVATADEVIADVNNLISQVRVNSKGINRVKRILIPVGQYAAIAAHPRSTLSDTTILNFLKLAHPEIEFMEWERLQGSGAGSTDRMVGYDPDPNKIELLMAREFTMEPPERKHYRFMVDCSIKTGGVICRYPKSVIFGDGI